MTAIATIYASTHLFPRKDVLVEVELKLLVGHIDQQLLKRVCPEVLESEDVQNPDIYHVLSSAMKSQMCKIPLYSSIL